MPNTPPPDDRTERRRAQVRESKRRHRARGTTYDQISARRIDREYKEARKEPERDTAWRVEVKAVLYREQAQLAQQAHISDQDFVGQLDAIEQAANNARDAIRGEDADAFLTRFRAERDRESPATGSANQQEQGYYQQSVPQQYGQQQSVPQQYGQQQSVPQQYGQQSLPSYVSQGPLGLGAAEFDLRPSQRSGRGPGTSDGGVHTVQSPVGRGRDGGLLIQEPVPFASQPTAPPTALPGVNALLEGARPQEYGQQSAALPGVNALLEGARSQEYGQQSAALPGVNALLEGARSQEYGQQSAPLPGVNAMAEAAQRYAPPTGGAGQERPGQGLVPYQPYQQRGAQRRGGMGR